MNAMRRGSHVASVLVLTLLMLILAACAGVTTTPVAGQEMLLSTPLIENIPCVGCAEATLIAQTQVKINENNQAAANAEVVRANAQATFNAANATLNAVQTQEQNNANVIAAQIAATAEIVRAQALATLNSAGATQNAALQQDAIRQTQAQYDLQVIQVAGTQSANAVMTQQGKNDLAAGTQTAIANNIATQTQIAASTAQWYVEQTRQREEQRQGPIDFLWMWCLPTFVVLLAGFALWGFWRWLRIQQANQRILENPVGKLPPPPTEFVNHRHALPYVESDIIENVSQLTTPDNEVHEWLDDVKNTLLDGEDKDEDDNRDN